MATTIKRTTIALTKETLRQLEKLSELMGENQNQVIKKSIDTLYKEYLKEKTMKPIPL